MLELPIADGGRGPKQLIGMVNLTPDEDSDNGFEVATLDTFHGNKNTIDDQFEDVTAVLSALHLLKLGTAAVDEVRRRVQQEIHGHRGRKNDRSAPSG